MNLKNVALSLMLSGSVFAIGCGGGDGDSGGSADLPQEDVPSCDLAADTDTMTRVYHIDTLAIPEANNIGFNLDGLNTTTNSDLPGCRKVDGQPGGIDNALAQIIDGLGDVLASQMVDINMELQGAIDSDAIDLTLTINHWNGTSTDACIGVVIAGTSGGVTIPTLNGSAGLSASVVSQIAFPTSLTITPEFTLGDSGTPTPLPITIAGVRGRLVFTGGADGMQTLSVAGAPNNTNSSVVAGSVRYAGEGGFQVGLQALVMQISPGLVGTVDTVFAGFLDLDTSPGPGLSACTSTGGNAVSADSFSAGILASGSIVAAP